MGSECQCMRVEKEVELNFATPIRKSPEKLQSASEDFEQNLETQNSKDSIRQKDPPLIFVHKPATIDLSDELFIEGYSELLAEIRKKYGKFDLSLPRNDGVPVHFQQEIFSNDEFVYKGEWNPNWNRHGRGIEIFNDGTVYLGYFSWDKRHGKGRLYKTQAFFYEGDFIEGKIEGYGHFIGQYEYKGTFKDNLKEGFGTETLPDGSKYEGEFKRGLKEGSGTLVLKNAVYNGQFKQNTISGKGLMKWNSNKSYEGEWLNGKMHGYGVFTWKDGRMYRGEYAYDLKNGRGAMFWPDGKMFDGHWLNGKQHGNGTVHYVDKNGKKTTFEGVWVHGKLN